MTSDYSKILETQRDAEISYMIKMGLLKEDAEDVFQEASIALYETINSQRLTMKGKPEAYLHGICQNMAFKRLEELKRNFDCVDEDQLDRLLELTEGPADEDPPEWDYHRILEELLSELSSRDYSLLKDFYLEGMCMEQVAKAHQLGSVEVARTTKCRIINRLRERAAVLIKEYF